MWAKAEKWYEEGKWDDVIARLPDAVATRDVQAKLQLLDGTEKTIKAKRYSAVIVYYNGQENVYIHSKYYKLVPTATILSYAKYLFPEDTAEKIRVKVANDGSRYWVEAVGKEEYNIAGDKYKFTLWIRNSFDGAWSLGIGYGAFRIACSNGVVMPAMIGEKEVATVIRKIHKGTWNVSEILQKIEQGKAEILRFLEDFIQHSYEVKVNKKLLERFRKRIPAYILSEYPVFAEDQAEAFEVWNALTEIATHKVSVKHREKYDKMAQEVMEYVIARARRERK